MGLEKDEDYETEVQISGCYKILSGTSPSHPVLIEHSCLMTPGNEWNMEVKCRLILQGAQGVSNQGNNWRSLMVVYPEAEVLLKHNDIEVTLPSLQEDVEIAAFGRPGKEDKKRMQMAIFAKRPKQGRDWKIWVYLVDDTSPACEKMFQDEDEKGNKLLTPLAGIFVSNSNKDIKIELSKLEPGWKIKGSNVKTIKSTHAWNSSGDSVDFPRCYFEISHVNSAKHSYFCGIEASHEGDSAQAEVVAYFERESGQKIVQPSNNSRKLSNTWNFVSKEITTRLPFHDVLTLLCALFASGLNTTHVTGSNSTYQQFTTKKDFKDFTNSKQPYNFIRMPRSGALAKRGKAGSASCGSTVAQDHAHYATARKPNVSERGNALQLFQKQHSQEVY
ncbi:Netrin receptor unc5c [Porites harrisoni]